MAKFSGDTACPTYLLSLSFARSRFPPRQLACLMFAADLVAARVAERGAGGAIRQCHLKDKLELNFLYLVFILNKLHQNVRPVHLTMRL